MTDRKRTAAEIREEKDVKSDGIIESIQKDLNTHIKNSDSIHKALKEHDTLVEGQLSYLADHLFGPAQPNFDGEAVRYGGRLDDLDDKIGTLVEAHQNGGINAAPFEQKLSPTAKASIWAALIASTGSIIVALVGAV